MALSQKQRDANLREKVLQIVIERLTSPMHDDLPELLRTGTGSIAIPVLDEEQFERYAKITIEIPTGERGGEPYNGHEEAEDFVRKQNLKVETAREREEAKAKKIAKDAAVRAAKKAEKEAEQE